MSEWKKMLKQQMEAWSGIEADENTARRTIDNLIVRLIESLGQI